MPRLIGSKPLGGLATGLILFKMKLRYKLILYNLLTKAIFVAAFLLVLPYFLEKVNIIQTDNELIRKREQIMDIIAEFGIDGLASDSVNNTFGSYNILKQEYISLERATIDSLWNFIEITQRMVDGEVIEYRVLNYSFKADGITYLLEIGTSLDNIYKTERNIRNISLILMGLFVVISFVTTTSISRILTRPVEQITLKLKNTNSPAFFDKKPIKTSTTDFQYLDTSLCELMEKTHQLFEKEREITANISHELLTPLSVVQSRLENLLSNGSLCENDAEKVSESLRTLHRLKGIINALLLIARVENRQFVKNESFFLVELIKEVIEEIEPVSVDKGLEIHTRFEADYCIVGANRSLLYALFFNILNNAVKFSGNEPKGPVVVYSYADNETFGIEINDCGPGMHADQAAELFERFKKRKSPNGHGLGLAIAKSIADFHNINIQVKTNLGQGTNFIFTFPKYS